MTRTSSLFLDAVLLLVTRTVSECFPRSMAWTLRQRGG
jgi:hypothetical protein